MGKTKAPHHRGTYPVESKRVRDQANANPLTRCWRCNRTLTEVRRVKPKAIWTAGHIYDGVPNSPLLPECSPCNYRHGALIGNRSPKRRKGAQWRPRLPNVTSIRW